MPFGLLAGAIPWKLIGLGLAALAIGLFVFLAVGAFKENGKLRGQVDTAIDIANGNAEIAKTNAAEVTRLQAIAAAAAITKTTLRKTSDTVRRNIADAPPQDDGPVAPVLRRELDRLPGQPGSDSDRVDPSAKPGQSVADPH